MTKQEFRAMVRSALTDFSANSAPTTITQDLMTRNNLDEETAKSLERDLDLFEKVLTEYIEQVRVTGKQGSSFNKFIHVNSNSAEAFVEELSLLGFNAKVIRSNYVQVSIPKVKNAQG